MLIAALVISALTAPIPNPALRDVELSFTRVSFSVVKHRQGFVLRREADLIVGRRARYHQAEHYLSIGYQTQ